MTEGQVAAYIFVWLMLIFVVYCVAGGAAMDEDDSTSGENDDLSF